MFEPAPGSTDLFEIIRTTRSIRRLKPVPVPSELVRKILEAGVCAPSGGNMQRWRFLVIKDADRSGHRRAAVRADLTRQLPILNNFRLRVAATKRGPPCSFTISRHATT